MAYTKYKWYRSGAAEEKPHHPQRRRSEHFANGAKSFQWYSPVAAKENETRNEDQCRTRYLGSCPDWNACSDSENATVTPSQWGRSWMKIQVAGDKKDCKEDDQTAYQSWPDASDVSEQPSGSSTDVRSESHRAEGSQNEEKVAHSSYPRFATFTRRSSCKHTFIHFSETKYDTRRSVDDANITYRTYEQETISSSNSLHVPERTRTNRSRPQTLMICNIPCRFTQQELMAMLDTMGFGKTYNFFYLPMDGKRASKPHAIKKASNLGYAFVNFHTTEDAARFQSTFHGFCFVGYDGTLSKKVCKVAPARMQGFFENLRCYQRRITCDEMTRNAPFLDVPLKHFNMQTSKFIEWIFSPTDTAQYLPECKDASWHEDTIICDNILPFSIDEQNELRYRKEVA